MICGIGTDLVFIPRIRQMLERFGDKAARRILDAEEFLAFQGSSQPAAFLAKRFAAKEAAAKALGTGFRDGLSLQHIAVRNDELGKPALKLIAVAQHKMSQIKASRAFLSLSDDGDYASAYVILTEG